MITLKVVAFLASLLVTFIFAEHTIENIIIFCKKPYDDIKRDMLVGKPDFYFLSTFLTILVCILWTVFYML